MSAAEFSSTDPCTGKAVWSGKAASQSELAGAVDEARAAQRGWAERSIDDRRGVLLAFAEGARNSAELLEAIIRETGKPRWEAKAELDAVAGKIAISIGAQKRRQGEEAQSLGGGVIGRVWYRPLGVVAVIGPFNFPAHLPNGHIAPALLAGNAAVFKPSEQSPRVAEVMAELWRSAGLPTGLFHVVQGGREVAEALVARPIDAVYFTGSDTAGRAIHRALADRPWVLCALEMGGNNPLVVHEASSAEVAAEMIVTSAFATAGQRCTCARRLILVDAEAVLDRVIERTKALRVGRPEDVPEPFMGPVISEAAAERVVDAQRRLIASGAKSLVELGSVGPRRNFLSPGIVDVTEVEKRADEEIFGPLLTVIRVRDFDAAVEEANRTRFGLTAGLISDNKSLREAFVRGVHAGVIHFNRPTTGASSKLPFGGIKSSGNHRAGAAFAADYCADPVAVAEA